MGCLLILAGAGGCGWVQNFLIGAFKQPCNISVEFNDAETRKQVILKVVLLFFCDCDVFVLPHFFCWRISGRFNTLLLPVLQANIKRENGQMGLVSLFQSQESVVGEVCSADGAIAVCYWE